MSKVILVGSYAKSLILFRGPLLEDLVRAGHEVIACAPEIPESIEAELKKLGVRAESIRFARTGLNPFEDLSTVRDLMTLFRATRPDVVLSYTIKPVIYASIAAQLCGVKTRAAMITGLGYAFAGTGVKRSLISGIAKTLYRIALRGTRVVFFQNPDDQEVFRGLGLLRRPTTPVVVNGSGIDVTEYTKQPLPNDVIFLFVARLLVEKGIREYVDAARQVRVKLPGARFLVVGWIDENPNTISEEELDEWIQEGCIEYVGRVDDVRPYLAQCSVFVLPSYYPEGTPRTILEAMATGRAIVTADSPGCRETVIEGRNGYLVPPRDSSTLTDRLLRLSENQQLREDMGEESRKIAESKYDVRKVNAVMLQALGLQTS